jgi:hypothetical protein
MNRIHIRKRHEKLTNESSTFLTMNPLQFRIGDSGRDAAYEDNWSAMITNRT